MFREPIDEPEPELSEDGIREILLDLHIIERQYGMVILAITRRDVEDAWKEDHFADELDPPDFTDELWTKFQTTYEWNKGLLEVMWQEASSLLTVAMSDFAKENSTERLK